MALFIKIFIILEIKPFIEIRLLEKLNHSSTIREFKYFKVFVQETSLKLDLIFIGALLRITEDKTQNGKNEVNINFFISLKNALIVHADYKIIILPNYV